MQFLQRRSVAAATTSIGVAVESSSDDENSSQSSFTSSDSDDSNDSDSLNGGLSAGEDANVVTGTVTSGSAGGNGGNGYIYKATDLAVIALAMCLLFQSFV